MRTKDAEKIVAATATAGALFVGLVVFRLVKSLVLLGQLARRGKEETFNDTVAGKEKK